MRIRTAVETDAAAISGLLRELGHPLEPALVAARITELSRVLPPHGVFVATIEGVVVGVATAFASPVLHRAEPVGISVLVVSSSSIGTGVGSALLLHVGAFLRGHGCERIEVTSAAHRHLAHEFYRRRGYEQQGVRLSKAIP